MPNYSWKCQQCSHEFDARADHKQIVHQCPQCRIGAAIRQPSAPAFVVKGKWTEKNGYGSR